MWPQKGALQLAILLYWYYIICIVSVSVSIIEEVERRERGHRGEAWRETEGRREMSGLRCACAAACAAAKWSKVEGKALSSSRFVHVSTMHRERGRERGTAG